MICATRGNPGEPHMAESYAAPSLAAEACKLPHKPASHAASVSDVSPTLLAAALSGLLCLSASACSSDDDKTEAKTDDKTEAKITASRVDASVTAESFEAECDELGGKIETHAHCGGANSCRGMSYDIDTHVFSEHTCKGLNTCRGFSCVVPESA